MRVTEISRSLIGEKLGECIYSDTGHLLLSKGVLLNEVLIEKIIRNKILYVYIDDEISEGIEINSIIDEELMIQSIHIVKQILSHAIKDNTRYNKNKNMISEEDIQEARDVIINLIKALDIPDIEMYTIVELMGTDMYKYRHCVNVAILTILTCKSLDYNNKIIKKIALGALLHDIGKSIIGDIFTNKVEELSEEEIIKIHTHTQEGYDWIKHDITLSGYTKQTVRLHHEKLDGSGYPLQLKGDKIPDYIRVVTICDMFDAMTSDRSYKKRIPVYLALDALMFETVYKLDLRILKIFMENICVYPNGTGVRLSDGRFAIIAKYNNNYPRRPKIRVFNNSKDNTVNYENIDLMNYRTLFISETVDTEIIKKEIFLNNKENIC